MIRNPLLAATALLALACAGEAQADPITFTESTYMTGTFDGHTISTPTLVTFEVTADPSTAQPYSNVNTGYLISAAAGSTMVTVGSFGTDTITDNILVIATNSGQGAPSFSLYDYTGANPANGSTILGTDNGFFTTYDLSSTFAPITDVSYGTTGVSFGTTSGGLTFSSIDSTSTASALPSASPALVPEPSSIVLTGLAGVFALGFYRTPARMAAKRS